MQEIKNKGNLLNIDGTPVETGYAKKDLLVYNREDIKKKGRIREWDYFLISDRRYALSLAVAYLGSVAVVSASVVDFVTNRTYAKTSTKYFPKDKDFMPHALNQGTTALKTKKADFLFENRGRRKLLKGVFEQFYKVGNQSYDLNFEIELTNKSEEQVVRVANFKRKAHFVYNQKVNYMQAAGKFSFKEKTYVFDDTALATMDWGRGVLPHKNLRYWANFQHQIGRDVVALNIGRGLGEDDVANENMVFVNGKAHKLGKVKIFIRRDNYKKDYMRTWTFYDEDGKLELIFEPDIDKHKGFYNICASCYPHQVFGQYSGRVVLEDGKEIELINVPGFAMRVLSRN